MTLGVGDKLPQATFGYIDSSGKMQQITTDQLCKGKKVVILGAPGAFTPTCSLQHVPSFTNKLPDLKSKGIDTLAITTVNDPFVQEAWAKQNGFTDKVQLLADGSATFAKACGFEIDLTQMGMGVRVRRFAAVVDDGVIKILKLEEGGEFTISNAEEILSNL